MRVRVVLVEVFYRAREESQLEEVQAMARKVAKEVVAEHTAEEGRKGAEVLSQVEQLHIRDLVKELLDYGVELLVEALHHLGYMVYKHHSQCAACGKPFTPERPLMATVYGIRAYHEECLSDAIGGE